MWYHQIIWYHIVKINKEKTQACSPLKKSSTCCWVMMLSWDSKVSGTHLCMRACVNRVPFYFTGQSCLKCSYWFQVLVVSTGRPNKDKPGFCITVKSGSHQSSNIFVDFEGYELWPWIWAWNWAWLVYIYMHASEKCDYGLWGKTWEEINRRCY